jgi:hypothetical protein
MSEKQNLPPQQPQASDEFFYLDDDGNKQDADLHEPIIASGDRLRGLRAPAPPIDEKLMAPIRDKHRATWLAKRKAQQD